jgi:hypothetical protein
MYRESCTAFYDRLYSERPELAEIVRLPVAFRIWVNQSAIAEGQWKVIGYVELSESERAGPDFFIFDTIAKKFFIYNHVKPIPATREQCLPLEAAAAWYAHSIHTRSLDHFAGRAKSNRETTLCRESGLTGRSTGLPTGGA